MRIKKCIKQYTPQFKHLYLDKVNVVMECSNGCILELGVELGVCITPPSFRPLLACHPCHFLRILMPNLHTLNHNGLIVLRKILFSYYSYEIEIIIEIVNNVQDYIS